MYLFIYLFITPINKRCSASKPFSLCPSPTCLSSFQKGHWDRMKGESLKSRYLSQWLSLSGAEAQSIMGEVPKCTTKLEFISWYVASIVRQKTQALKAGPGKGGERFGILRRPAP